jgi:hypothetical protein
MRRDRPVERGPRRPHARQRRRRVAVIFTRAPEVEHGAQRALHASPHLVGAAHEHGVARRLAELGRGARRQQDGTSRLARQPQRAAREQLQVARHRLGAPRLDGRRDVRGVGMVVEHQRHQLDPGRPVDRRVVDDGEDGEALAGQALDDVRQPQWPRAVERSRDDAPDHGGELVVAPGRRDRRVADVEVQIEVRVLDPVRMVEPERHLDEAPAQRLEQMQAPLDLPAPRRVGVVAGGVGAGVDRQPADVSELGARLEVQERRIQSRQLLHLVPFRRRLSSTSGRARRPAPDDDRGSARLRSPARPDLARTARAAFRALRAQVTGGSGLRNAIGVGLPLTLGVATGNVAAGVSLAGGRAAGRLRRYRRSGDESRRDDAGRGRRGRPVVVGGMTTGGGELATIAVTAIWGFVGALLIALGRAGTIGLLSTVGLIVVADHPSSAGQALHHAAFALAGGAFQASLALVFAPGPDRAPRRAVAQACRALGADVGQPRTSAFKAAVREAQAIVGRSAGAEAAPPLMRELRGALDELDRLYIELRRSPSPPTSSGRRWSSGGRARRSPG